jgi:hypothetical protein
MDDVVVSIQRGRLLKLIPSLTTAWDMGELCNSNFLAPDSLAKPPKPPKPIFSHPWHALASDRPPKQGWEIVMKKIIIADLQKAFDEA